MIVITGATGQIGSQLLARVLPAGEAVRVIARDPARLPAEVRERVEVIEGSYGDPQVVSRAWGVTRTAQDAIDTPTTFRQWCTDTLKPAVEGA